MHLDSGKDDGDCFTLLRRVRNDNANERVCRIPGHCEERSDEATPLPLRGISPKGERIPALLENLSYMYVFTPLQGGRGVNS